MLTLFKRCIKICWHRIILSGLLMPGCAAAHTIKDDLGHSIPTTPAARRIITLAPHATEIIQAIGAQDLLVAVASHSPNVPASMPRISAFGGLDRELVLQLQPDLVIAWASGNKPRDLAWLAGRGIRVYRSEPAELAQLADSMRAIGALVQRLKQAGQAARRFGQALAQACQNKGDTEVYFSIWHRPAMTVGGVHWLNDVLHYAGMRNTYAAIQQGVFSVEAEARFAKQNLVHLSSYPLPADEAENRITIDALSRPGPAIIPAIQQLCQSTGTDREFAKFSTQSSQ